MKRRIKAMAVLLALAAMLSVTGCANRGETAEVTTTENPDKELENDVNWDEMADIDSVDAENEEGTGKSYVAGQKAGNVQALCYYDIVASSPDVTEMFAQRYGGTLETTLTTSTEYFDKLGALIASGDSPDLVRYDWEAYPNGVYKNRYTALDDWLDMDSPLWSGEKSVIESFSYLGKHYYYPSNVQPNYAMIYNKKHIEDNGMKDPVELYNEGNWTWDTFEALLKQWAKNGEDYIGFTGNAWSSMMFVNTTGVKTIDFTGTDIINNLHDANVSRTMDWLAGMKKEGYIGNGYIHPGEALVDGKLLFLGMGLQWGYESAQESFYKNSIEGEIAAVPFPRDPKADKYYLAADTFGYMIPAGAVNVQGSVQWILTNRIYETDPEIIAERREEMMDEGPAYYAKCPECKYNFVENDNDDLTTCPECNAPRKQKYKVIYSAEQLQIIDDMTNPEKFGLIIDNTVGFGKEFSNIFVGGDDVVFDGPLFHGLSYTQKIEECYNTIEAYLEPYRTALKEG